MTWYIEEQGKVYLDYNATTPIDKDVERSMVNAFQIWGNPSSNNELGKSLSAKSGILCKKKKRQKDSSFFNFF